MSSDVQTLSRMYKLTKCCNMYLKHLNSQEIFTLVRLLIDFVYFRKYDYRETKFPFLAKI